MEWPFPVSRFPVMCELLREYRRQRLILREVGSAAPRHQLRFSQAKWFALCAVVLRLTILACRERAIRPSMTGRSSRVLLQVWAVTDIQRGTALLTVLAYKAHDGRLAFPRHLR